MTNVPAGATHRYYISYHSPVFYKWAIYGYDLRSDQPYYGWFRWNGLRWEADNGVDETRFERIF